MQFCRITEVQAQVEATQRISILIERRRRPELKTSARCAPSPLSPLRLRVCAVFLPLSSTALPRNCAWARRRQFHCRRPLRTHTGALTLSTHAGALALFRATWPSTRTVRTDATRTHAAAAVCCRLPSHEIACAALGRASDRGSANSHTALSIPPAPCLPTSTSSRRSATRCARARTAS